MSQNFNFDSLENILPKRSETFHKGDNGRVLIFAGSKGMGGAGILSSEASLYCGSGLVTLLTDESNIKGSLSRNPEVMAVSENSLDDIKKYFQDKDIFLCGPGLENNSWSEEVLLQILNKVDLNSKIVLDAGALHIIKSKNITFNNSTILTPHPGEAASLLNISVDDVQSNRINAAKNIATLYDASAVILKGHESIVYDSNEGNTHICDEGGPELASGGTGDVLSGVLSALLAQGMSEVDASLLAVASHARAGTIFKEKIGEIGLNASSLVPIIRKLINQ